MLLSFHRRNWNFPFFIRSFSFVSYFVVINFKIYGEVAMQEGHCCIKLILDRCQ